MNENFSRIYGNMYRLQCGISLLFVLGQSLEDAEISNITFVPVAKSWLDAKDYCFSKGQVLADETAVYTHNHSVERVWLGYFKTYTPWAAIIGCFKLQTYSRPLNVSYGEYLQCQRLCPQNNYNYFTLKGVSCYCLTSINVNMEVPFKTCLENDPNEENNYFLIYKQNITSDRIGAHGNGLCMSAQCESTKLVRFSEKCNISYEVICVNGTLTEKFLSYDQGVEACKRMFSYIKWYPDDVCSKPISSGGQHWTSARMTIEWFSLSNSDKYQHVNPLLCRSGAFEVENQTRMKDENCSTSLPFLCTYKPWQNGDSQTTYPTSTGQKETDSVTEPGQKGDDQTTYHTSTGKKETDSVTGIAIGSVVAVVVITVGIVGGIVLYRRRQFLDKTTANTTEITKKPSSDHVKRTTTLYHDIDPNQICSNKNKNATNLVYFSQPINNEQSQNTAFYDMPTSSKHKDIENSDKNIDVSLKTKNENTTRNKTTKTNDYCLAKPGLENEEIDPYMENTDYDHFNNVANTANTNDYCLAKPGLDHEDIDPYTDNTDYDHLNNVAKKETILKTLKVYDHLPTSVDSDPTYDRADIKMFKAKNGNYDSFTVQ